VSAPSSAPADRAARSPVTSLRRLAAHPRLLPLTARLITARLVRESGRFFLRELTRPAGMHTYRLRATGDRVVLRHSAQDGATMAEVFHRHDYEPPPEVATVLGEPRSILDLGANIGLFGIFAARRWPSSQIVAYEADPDNAVVHERAISVNGLADRWSLVTAAAGASAREVELAAGRAMGSFVVQPGTDVGVPTIRVPVRDVLAEVQRADLVKIDIEGGEWEIVLDPRFASEPPRVLVVEYHPHLGPGGDPRQAAERAFRDAGLRMADIWHRDDGYGMLWAWRP
jgi:FkbM family methyltransferase